MNNVECKRVRFKYLRDEVVSIVEKMELVEGLNVLTSAMNELSASHGYGVVTTLRPLLDPRRIGGEEVA